MYWAPRRPPLPARPVVPSGSKPSGTGVEGALDDVVSHGLVDRIGKWAEFARHLLFLRTTHNANRNLLELLDQTPWP